MKEEKIILYDSPEAARLLTPEDLIKAPVWVARDPYNFNGYIYTTDEHLARNRGCTHKTCTLTGEVFPRSYSHGPTVRARREEERYQNLPQVEVGPDTKFSFMDDDKIYADTGELLDAMDAHDLEDIGYVTIAEPVNYRPMDVLDYWGDDMYEGEGLDSPQIIGLVKQLNEEVAKENPAYYLTSTRRPTDACLEELRKEFKAAMDLRSKQE
jgi:hypothetical protein